MKAHDILEHCTCCEESYADDAYDELDRLESDFLELEAKCDAQGKEIKAIKVAVQAVIDLTQEDGCKALLKRAIKETSHE